MSRSICIGLVCLAWSWANGVNSVDAQPYAQPAKTDKLVRVTYPVGDLVVPIEDHSFRAAGKPRSEPAAAKETMAERLMKTITETVAKGSWESNGGAGTIQYFPFGMAIVVHNNRDVQDKIAALLADLRRLQDVQVSVELRLVLVSSKGMKELEQHVEKHGENMRVSDRTSNLTPNGAGKSIRSLDDKQLFRFLEMVQRDRAAHIIQTPKLTLFNAQQATIASVMQSAKGERECLMCDVWPVVEPQHKTVRLALNLELSGPQKWNPAGQHVKASGTFALPTDRTLVWRLGETKDRQHLFALVTARVILNEEEPRAFLGDVKPSPRPQTGSTEEQSLPEPTKVDPLELLLKDIFDLIGVQKWEPEAGLTLPSAHYLRHPPQYFPPSEPYPLPRELRSLEEAAKQAETQSKRPFFIPIGFSTPAKQPGAESQPQPEPKKTGESQSLVKDVLDIQRAIERAMSKDGDLIQQRLRQPISLYFKDVPLRQVVKDLSTFTGIQVVLDEAHLKDARVNLDATLSISVDNVDLKSALNLLVNRLRLAWTIENEAIMITTRPSGSSLPRKTYIVGDLVVPMVTFEGQKQGKTEEAVLMELITNTVAKNSWETWGGQGSMQYFPKDKALVVAQTNEVHEEIDQLLATLRRLCEPPLEFETRLVSTSPGMAKQMRKTLAQQGKRVDLIDAPPSSVFVSIDDAQMFMLLEAAQGDRRTHVTQAPKLTLFNGEGLLGGFRPEKHIGNGWSFDVRPVVSPDRRSVRLAISTEIRTSDKERSVERITKAARTLSVPDGRTLVWDLGENMERQHVFLLVTPRIRVREEAETKVVPLDLLPIPGR